MTAASSLIDGNQKQIDTATDNLQDHRCEIHSCYPRRIMTRKSSFSGVMPPPAMMPAHTAVLGKR